MKKTEVQCRKCNQYFSSMEKFNNHRCSKEDDGFKRDGKNEDEDCVIAT